MTYEASSFLGTSQIDFEYDEATIPEPTMGKIKTKKTILIKRWGEAESFTIIENHDYVL